MGNPDRPLKNHHVQCKKHPKHKQSPGVCSLCLNEKLSLVSKTRLRGTRTDSSSCSSSLSPEHSSYSSSCSSSYSSPMHRRYRFSTREGSNKGSLSFMFRGKNNFNALTKSRSLAFVPRRGGGDHDDAHSDNYKKKTTRGGFWSKLLHPRRKKNENVLMHSSTMREGRTIVVS